MWIPAAFNSIEPTLRRTQSLAIAALSIRENTSGLTCSALLTSSVSMAKRPVPFLPPRTTAQSFATVADLSEGMGAGGSTWQVGLTERPATHKPPCAWVAGRIRGRGRLGRRDLSSSTGDPIVTNDVHIAA